MKLFKRGKIWWGRWSVDGTQVRESSHTENEKLAREYLSKKYAESFREDKLGDKPRRTWAEATKRYLGEHEHIRTYKNYEAHSEFWNAEFSKRKLTYLDELDPEVIKEIRSAELARPKERGGGKRSPADVNRKIAYLRSVMNAAYREWRWFGPGEEAPLYRLIPGEKERVRYLDPSEVFRVAEHLPGIYGTMAKMAVATGLRRSNVMRMQWDHIDLGSRSATIPGVLMKNGETLRIPLNQMAVDILRGQMGKSTVWVFPMADGKPAKEIPSKVWKRALAKAGVEDFRWHDLRHTWASLARQNGVPLEALQELGGWKDSRMVLRYSHLSIDHLRTHANVLDGAFSTDLAQEGSANNLKVAVNG